MNPAFLKYISLNNIFLTLLYAFVIFIVLRLAYIITMIVYSRFFTKRKIEEKSKS